MRTLGVQFGCLLSGLHYHLAGVLCLLWHQVANGNHLRVLRHEPFQQVSASPSHADEPYARVLGCGKGSIDHCLSLSGRHDIRKRALLKPEGGSGHGANLQKLAPAGIDEIVFHGLPLSYAKEDFATVHPEQKQPVNQQNRSPKKQWLQSWTENQKSLVAEVGNQITSQKPFP